MRFTFSSVPRKEKVTEVDSKIQKLAGTDRRKQKKKTPFIIKNEISDKAVPTK